MKIRAGFVSNSSSSSFALCGVCVSYDEIASISQYKGPDEDFDAEEELIQLGFTEEEFLSDDGQIYVGNLLAHCWDGDFTDVALPIDNLINEAAKKAGDIFKKQPLLYIGTVAS